MRDFFRRVPLICAQDPGCRGLASHIAPPEILPLARELRSIHRALVVTGFPVPSAAAGETDGPGGAVNIAKTLLHLGHSATIVTDAVSAPLITALCKLLTLDVEIAVVPMDNPQPFCLRLLQTHCPSHIISIERPGKHGGHYYNMRGQCIDPWVADTDILFSAFSGVTIAVGDGGNELGMGAFRETILRHVKNGDAIGADLGCDYPLISGVSNWWGWAFQAILSLATGRDLLSTPKEEEHMLHAVVDAGGVDGVLGCPAMSVDGIPLEDHMRVLQSFRDLVGESRSATLEVAQPNPVTCVD